MSSWFYILRLNSGQLYCGATSDLDRRLEDHKNGNACRTTKLDPFDRLVFQEEFDSFTKARKREAQVKKWTRAKKEALITGDIQQLKALSISRD